MNTYFMSVELFFLKSAWNLKVSLKSSSWGTNQWPQWCPFGRRSVWSPKQFSLFNLRALAAAYIIHQQFLWQGKEGSEGSYRSWAQEHT